MSPNSGQTRTFRPLYPRLALLTLLGSPTLFLVLTVVGILGEFLGPRSMTLVKLIAFGLLAPFILRIIDLKVVSSPEGLIIKNPLKTYSVDYSAIAGLRTNGLVYRWLTLAREFDRPIAVASSFFVTRPVGGDAKALHILLWDLVRRESKEES